MSYEPVFNLEVDADHCYRVGEQGILVHNASAPIKQGMDYGCGNPAGDGRLDPCNSGLLDTKLGGCMTDYQAHHLIACSVRNTNAIKRATLLGFDINGELNGWCLPSEVPESKKTKLPLHRGRHVSSPTGPNYFICVASLLTGLENQYNAGLLNDCQLCAKVKSVIRKIRRALRDHKIWLQYNDPNVNNPTATTSWKCPSY